MSITQGDIIKAAVSLDTSLAQRFFYKVQCCMPLYGWCDWMPKNELLTFSFREDAKEEIDRCVNEGIPEIVRGWRIVFCAMISEVVEVVKKKDE